MSRKIILRDDAFRDLDESSATIGQDAPHASVRFLQEAQKAFGLLADMPGIGAPRDYNNPTLTGMRMWPISRFRKYLIFYLTTDETIEIVRVLHGSQNIQSLFSPSEE